MIARTQARNQQEHLHALRRLMQMSRRVHIFEMDEKVQGLRRAQTTHATTVKLERRWLSLVYHALVWNPHEDLPRLSLYCVFDLGL